MTKFQNRIFIVSFRRKVKLFFDIYISEIKSQRSLMSNQLVNRHASSAWTKLLNQKNSIISKVSRSLSSDVHLYPKRSTGFDCINMCLKVVRIRSRSNFIGVRQFSPFQSLNFTLRRTFTLPLNDDLFWLRTAHFGLMWHSGPMWHKTPAYIRIGQHEFIFCNPENS